MDRKISENPELAARFPDAPAVHGKAAESLITYVKDRPGHDARYAIDATKTTHELGYKPVETFETGIERTVDWYLANESWWRAVMDGSYKDWIDLQYADRRAG